MSATRRLHRWVSLVLGAALLVVTTTGCVLLFRSEIFAWGHPEMFRSTAHDRPVPVERALSAAEARYPDLRVRSVAWTQGVYLIRPLEGDDVITVDPGSGRVLGRGEDGTLMGLVANVHECLLSCDDRPGYVAWLGATVPWVGLSVGDFALGALGVVLLVLCLTGLALWWPGVRRWRRGFAVRRGKGRYARDHDLHKVIGLAAIPFLMMWAVTGAGFQFDWVHRTWYALLPGGAPAGRALDFPSTPGTGPDIGVDRAVAAAVATAGGGSAGYVRLPEADDPAGSYWVRLVKGVDPSRHGRSPGNVDVGVDRRTGRSQVLAGMNEPLSRTVWEDWAGATHFGRPVNGWWRMVWLLFGLTPIALGVTGVSTWLWRRSRGRRRPPAGRTPAAR